MEAQSLTSLSKLLSSAALLILVVAVCYNTIKGHDGGKVLENLVTIVALYSHSPSLLEFYQGLKQSDDTKL